MLNDELISVLISTILSYLNLYYIWMIVTVIVIIALIGLFVLLIKHRTDKKYLIVVFYSLMFVGILFGGYTFIEVNRFSKEVKLSLILLVDSFKTKKDVEKFIEHKDSDRVEKAIKDMLSDDMYASYLKVKLGLEDEIKAPTIVIDNSRTNTTIMVIPPDNESDIYSNTTIISTKKIIDGLSN